MPQSCFIHKSFCVNRSRILFLQSSSKGSLILCCVQITMLSKVTRLITIPQVQHLLVEFGESMRHFRWQCLQRPLRAASHPSVSKPSQVSMTPPCKLKSLANHLATHPLIFALFFRFTVTTKINVKDVARSTTNCIHNSLAFVAFMNVSV